MEILRYRHQNKHLALILTAGAINLFISYAAAQTPKDNRQLPAADSIQVQRLNEVVVKSAENSARNTSAAPLQILKGKALERLNSLSVADAVRYFSGVQLKDYGGIGGLKTINVRSMGTNHTAVFYDGVQLGNAQNGQVDLGKFSLDNIEEIALYNGQKPDLLQSARAYSSANAMYLKAKVPVFFHDKNYNAVAALKAGSFGLTAPSLAIDYKLTDNLYSRFSTEFINANGRYRFRYTNGVYDTTAVRNNGDISAFRVEAALYGKRDSGDSWSLKFYHYHSERGLPGAIVANKFDYTQRQWDDNNFIQAGFQKKVKPWYTLALNAKYADDYTRYLDPEFVTTTGFLDNRYKQQEGYFSLANQFQLLPFWNVALAADYQFNTLDANLYRFAYPVRNTLLAVLATSLQFKRLNIQASLLSTTVNESVKEFQSAGNKQEYTPTFMFNWQPLNLSNIRLRGFYKSIFRMPTFNDLYYTFVGNTFLRPEYTRQYDLGITWVKTFSTGIINNIDLQSDIYYNEVTDKIVAVPGANLFRWTMLNLGEVKIKGLELSAKASGNLSPQFTFSGGIAYTYQQALDITEEPLSYRQQIPYTPIHSGSFIASTAYKQFGFNYSFIYTGERYSQKANIPANYIAPWYTHDVSGQYTYTKKRHMLSLRAEANNLFNQYYDVILNFPMSGRSYRFTLSYTI